LMLQYAFAKDTKWARQTRPRKKYIRYKADNI
jgi:hypothetical protein